VASVTSLSCLASQIRRGAVEDEGASEGSSRVARPNGLDALRLTPVYQPNVVLLDVLMPGMLAIDVLKVLRRDHPAIPVVMVTGILDEAAARELLARGALDYVRKALQPRGPRGHPRDGHGASGRGAASSPPGGTAGS